MHFVDLLCVLLYMTEKTSGKTVKVLAADFTKDNVYESIEKTLKNQSVGILGKYHVFSLLNISLKENLQFNETDNEMKCYLCYVYVTQVSDRCLFSNNS